MKPQIGRSDAVGGRQRQLGPLLGVRTRLDPAAASLTASAGGGLNWHHSTKRGATMRRVMTERAGKVGYIILWLLGVPLPILLIAAAIRGCG